MGGLKFPNSAMCKIAFLQSHRLRALIRSFEKELSMSGHRGGCRIPARKRQANGLESCYGDGVGCRRDGVRLSINV
jgi:hypothetical protein